MKTKPIYLYILVFLFAMIACSSPKKLYEKGKYFKAFDGALGELTGKNKNRENLLLLNKSFSKMIDVSRDEMVLLEDGYKVKELENNFEKYEEVIKRFTKARSFINDENDSKYAVFYEEQQQLISDAYEEGKALLAYYEESEVKIDARNAYYHFELVDKYSSRIEDIQSLMDIAKEMGTVVYNVDADLDSDFSYQWEVDRRFDDLEGHNGFKKIVYDKDYSIGDCVIELDFSRLDIDERDSESTRSYSKKVIDGYNTVTDTSGKTTKEPIYVTVNASVRTQTITKSVSWYVDLEIRKSNKNCTLREKRFQEEVRQQYQIHKISGDDRAVPENILNDTQNNDDSTDDMVDDLIDELYSDIRYYLQRN